MHAVDYGDAVMETASSPALIGYDKPEMVLRAITNLLNLGRNGGAEQVLFEFLEEHPDNAHAYGLLGTVHERAGDMVAALGFHERAVELAPDNKDFHSALIFALDQSPDVTLERAYRARRAYNEIVKVETLQPHTNDRDPERRIRLGYISNDFKNHSAAFGFAPVILVADREQFDLYVYHCSPGADERTEDFKAAVPNWRDVAWWDDDRLEAQIRADQIDVLVDLSGHSSGNRLTVLARKPAPVQITAFGYITGTGLDAMDYLFADEDTILTGEYQWYAEEVVNLPRILTFWAADPSTIGDVPPLPALENGYLTFGYFGRLGKIQAPCVDAWTRILAQVPTARMILKCPGLDDQASRDGLALMFSRSGCDLSRLEFRGMTTKNEHLIAHYAADVALDPSPHGGGMGALESNWCGVPVLTMPHIQIPSRIATTINRELGLGYLIADSWDDYVARAVALDAQRDRLSKVRGLLRDMMRISAFGDHGRYSRNYESRIRECWRRWCAGDEPKRLRVVS